MKASRIKQNVVGTLVAAAMLVFQPAMAAGLNGVQVLDGFRELAG
jgi:polar amino acid transport system permease protein